MDFIQNSKFDRSYIVEEDKKKALIFLDGAVSNPSLVENVKQFCQ